MLFRSLAIIAYMLRFVETERSWAQRLAELLRSFPASHALSVESIGVPPDWHALDLWRE